MSVHLHISMICHEIFCTSPVAMVQSSHDDNTTSVFMDDVVFARPYGMWLIEHVLNSDLLEGRTDLISLLIGL